MMQNEHHDPGPILKTAFALLAVLSPVEPFPIFLSLNFSV